MPFLRPSIIEQAGTKVKQTESHLLHTPSMPKHKLVLLRIFPYDETLSLTFKFAKSEKNIDSAKKQLKRVFNDFNEISFQHLKLAIPRLISLT